MKTYEHVYDILSKSPDFVTGESLAKSLGVSRTAIWKACLLYTSDAADEL